MSLVPIVVMSDGLYLDMRRIAERAVPAAPDGIDTSALGYFAVGESDPAEDAFVAAGDGEDPRKGIFAANSGDDLFGVTLDDVDAAEAEGSKRALDYAAQILDDALLLASETVSCQDRLAPTRGLRDLLWEADPGFVVRPDHGDSVSVTMTREHALRLVALLADADGTGNGASRVDTCGVLLATGRPRPVGTRAYVLAGQGSVVDIGDAEWRLPEWRDAVRDRGVRLRAIDVQSLGPMAYFDEFDGRFVLPRARNGDLGDSWSEAAFAAARLRVESDGQVAGPDELVEWDEFYIRWREKRAWAAEDGLLEDEVHGS